MELAILVFSVIAQLCIGLFTFFNNRKSYTQRFFLFLTVASSLWSITTYLSLHQDTVDQTLNLIRWNMVCGILWALSIFLTIHTFPSPKIRLNKVIFAGVLILTFLIMVLARTPLIFKSASGIGAAANPIPGPAIPLFGLATGFFLLGSVYILFSRYRKSRGVQKAQIQYLMAGIIGSNSMVFISNFLLVVVFKITSLVFLGPLFLIPSVAFTAYAIVAHQLFDIRVIIKKTLEYSGLLIFALGTYSTIIFIISTLLGGSQAFNATNFGANLFAAFLIAVGFEPIKRYLTRVTDKYLFKGEYDTQAVLSELSRQLSASLDIRQATQSLVMLVKKEMRIKHTAVITFTTEESQVVVKDAIQDGYPDASLLQLRPENLLLQQFARSPQVIVTDMFRRDCESGNPTDLAIQTCKLLLVDLDKLQAAIAIPILVDQKAIGMFLVGEKLSGDVFTKDDVEFLTIVANQTANTIEKTRFWEEDQMKSEFVSIASHELLTPTAAMKGYLSMILEENMGQVDDTARRYLTKVASSADRLAILVEDLLNVSRIESGRLKINKREFSLIDHVKKAVDELQVNAKKKSLDLAFVVPETPLANVYADPDHIYRVLVNLIGNSIKYTQQGWVRCFVTQMSPTHLLFTVSDSGLGIPAENLPHLFEKFYRADRKEIAGIQGTGLGLYISKKIVDLMGGQMWVQSEVGKGTNFYFTLPISTANTASQPAQPTVAAAAQ